MFKIETKLLNAISQFAAVQDVRYYINGVLLELQDGVPRMVATDGTLAGVCRLEDEYPDTPDGAWIMPNSMVGAIIKSKVTHVYLTVGPDSVENGGSATLSLSLGGAQMSFRAIEGVFPQWRRVIALNDTQSETSSFDAALLGRVAKASKLSGASKQGYFGLQHHGNHNALFTLDGVKICGAIVPLNLRITPHFDDALFRNIIG